MDLYNEETEFNVTHIPMFQRVVDMFEGRPQFQRIVRLGILANMGYTDELDVSSEDDYEFDQWVHGPSNSRRYPRPSDRNNDRGLSGNYTGSPSSADRLPLTYYTAASDRLPPLSVKVQAKESDTERRARLLQEAKKSKEKAEKKRIKKQKQKQRKQLEKIEKEKQNPAKNEEEKNEKKQSQEDESKPVYDKANSSVTNVASAKDTDSSNSSEDESSDEDSDTKNDSGDSEELDMTSTFVSKAAHKARQKLEQNSRTEKKEKKKSPVKEEPKTVSDKRNEQVEGNKDTEVEKKDPASPRCPTFEDNVKMSTDLANIGNKFASAGDFNMAVKYFTDAIKYNPTEFKLFGNRSFCFEKMQEYMKALTDAELSLSMCPGWVKGLFRKGRALAGLKRYEEAAEAFREVLKLESSCAEAAQELMRVQMTQLMDYGFTREQSSNALIIHGTVEKALEVLSQLHTHPGAVNNKSSLRLAQVANVSGVSPVLSANTSPALPQSQNAPKTPLKYKPLGPVQNMSNLKSQPQRSPNQAVKTSSEDSHPRQELFPVWVGNLFFPVTETLLADLFNKVGNVHSVKVLTYKRCAFVNFTKQEHCEEAIRRFNGFDLKGVNIAVRYPDRIPKGMGISKSALKAEDLQDENMGHFDHASGRYPVGRRPALPYRPPPDHRGNYKH